MPDLNQIEQAEQGERGGRYCRPPTSATPPLGVSATKFHFFPYFPVRQGKSLISAKPMAGAAAEWTQLRTEFRCRSGIGRS